MRETHVRWAKAAALLLSVAAAAPVCADPVEDFYRGKQMSFVIRSGVGGTYDLYGRLLAHHMSRHIPGNPAILPTNMGGGGGIKAANYMANIAPRDGTVLSIVSEGLPVDQGLGLNRSLEADLRGFNWIGNLNSAGQVVVVWHTSPVKTLDDALKREIVIGTTGAGSIAVQIAAVLVNELGVKFKLVVGYADAQHVNLAMERGEVEGRSSGPWPSFIAATPRYVSEKLITPLVQVGLEKEPELPHVPLLRDLARTEDQRQVFEFMSRAVAIGRPIATTPGVPADRVAALRAAFEATLADPNFLADAAKERLEIRPMSGKELAELINSVIETPIAVREKVKLAIQPNNPKTLPGAKRE